MYGRLYPSRYESRLYPSWYERDKGGDNEVLVTVRLETKNDSILGSRDRHVTMALQLPSLLDVSPVERVVIVVGSLVKNLLTQWEN